MGERTEAHTAARYPSSSSTDEVVWSRWDNLMDGTVPRSVHLLLSTSLRLSAYQANPPVGVSQWHPDLGLHQSWIRFRGSQSLWY